MALQAGILIATKLLDSSIIYWLLERTKTVGLRH